jgi:DNA transposition AAA+ family ATPase
MNGRTPNEVFDELLPVEKRQLPIREDLAPLFWERAKRTLREGGCVEIYNARYEPADPQSGARLQLHNATSDGSDRRLRPDEPGRSHRLRSRRPLPRLPASQERLNWNLSKEELRAHMRERAKLGRVTRDYLGGLARRRELAGDSTELDSMRERRHRRGGTGSRTAACCLQKQSRRCALAGSPPRPLQLPIIPPTSPSACARCAKKEATEMALSYQAKQELLKANLPQSNAARAAVQDYLLRADLSVPTSPRASIIPTRPSRSSSPAHTPRSPAPTSNIIRSPPPSWTRTRSSAPDEVQGKLYETSNVKLLRKCFTETLGKSCITVVEGDPATQKTFTLKWLIAEHNRREISKNGHGTRAFYVRSRIGIRPTDMLKRMAQAAGVISHRRGADQVLRNLRFDLRGRKSMFCVDEAQGLETETLETIREVHDELGCGLLLAGSHEFGKRLDFNAISLEQWNSRIHRRVKLPGLSRDEAEEIVRAEMGAKIPRAFVEEAIKGALADHLRAKDADSRKYVSIRRLMNALRDSKEAA